MTDLLQAVQKALGTGYRVERELGGGGMSRVFVAEEVALGRRVVVKVLPPDLAARVNVERFEREIRLSAALQHPGIVPLLSAGGADELLWFTMPFVEGDSLRARISSEGPLPLGDAVRIWSDLLDALEFAHARGVVHRDIKPENVLLSGRRALVADFGVARAISTATGAERFTGTGLSLGTPAYMSPEQAAGDVNADHRADLYAAGLVMYEMLVGKGPFAERSPVQQMSAHVTQPPPPVRDLRGEVSPPLAALVHRCLEKRPEDRPANAAEVLRALERVPDVTPGASRATSNPPRRRWAIAAALLVVLLAGGFAALQVRRLALQAPLPDSLRVFVAVLPVVREPGDSLLGRGLVQRLVGTLEQDRRLMVVSVEDQLGELAAMIDAAGGAAGVRDSIAAWSADLGTQANVTSSLARVGAEYLLSVEVRSLAGDSLLFSDQAGARDARELSEAVIAMAADARRALARSVGKLPETAPNGVFYRTSSDAAKLFAEGQRLARARDYLGAAERLRAAVRIDSTFALAWEALNFALGNAGINVDERNRARAAAFRHRHQIRLLPEQLGLEAEYYRMVGDNARAASVFERMERQYGPGGGRTNGLGLTYLALGRFDDGLRAFDRARDTTYRFTTFANQNYVAALLDLGRITDAEAEVARLAARAGTDAPSTRTARYNLFRARRQYDSVAHFARRELDAARTESGRIAARQTLRGALLVQGKLREADLVQRERRDAVGRAGATGTSLASQLGHLFAWVHLTGDTARAQRELAAALEETPWGSLTPMDRPYAAAIRLYGALGQVSRARELAAEWRRAIPTEFQPATSRGVSNALGDVELFAGRPREALRLFRESQTQSCPACYAPEYARAWDALGNADSTLHWYNVYLGDSSHRQAANDELRLAEAYRRSAELHEARGDVTRAIARYTAFLELWRGADPSLMPVVQAAERRVTALRATRQ